MEIETNSPFKSFETNGDNVYREIQKCIKNIVKKEGYINYNVDKKMFTPDGGNYLGVLCEVNIEGETAKEKKETNVFMKIMTGEVQMTAISLPEVYKRELFVYEELSLIFEELQNEMRLPCEERYKFIKYYSESNPRVIILENMNKKGFKTNFRMDMMTLQYAELAIKELAKFHGMSFVLESKRPKYYERKIKTLKTTFSFDKDWDGFTQNMCQITLNYLDKDMKRKLENFIPCFDEKYRKYTTGETGRLCLRHGDYRTNNILVKETNGEITDMIPIDYQLICYGSPLLDFIYLIFPSSDQKFRRSHLSHLKDLYYVSLKQFLNHFSLDVAKVYPRSDFEKDYKEMLDFGLMVSIYLVPFLMACENDVPDITKGPMADLSFNVDDQCKDRLVGVVQDFIEWGYIV